ncbi:unnamed protein product [Didymodactylos carnosus]|uniref:C2 domain-containing protein n=1 Tax=Didymodactylos carnosus TaxID=1234261 RepID=A0A814UQJ4_9BILA|nr:unnamed protein product [Didymodactylos carnosus]CAF3943226.1 unnamed protein product [Didymodactylos carnosus]
MLSSGPNRWRDSILPRKILFDVCKRNNLPAPVITGEDTMKIGDNIFHLADFEHGKHLSVHVGIPIERLALYVLHKLRLCPEHVETRPLYNLLQPEIEQGRLELFVDVFPKSQGPPGLPLVIQPRQPKPFVLRCIIWNTSDVILQDVSIMGEKMSDIYVKGWLSGLEEDTQKTDIHYRSLDGSGNFNWRFVFNFEYIPTERSIAIRKKEHYWSIDTTETKQQPVLNLQIWDNDKFSADDFLGFLMLDLNRLTKPAKDADYCKLSILDHHKNSTANLFEMKRVKGWWPCIDVDEHGEQILTGKVELELEVVTEEEAQARPAGKARGEPNENPTLQPPKRPETSFDFISSPWKTWKHVIWKKSKWYTIAVLCIVIVILFILISLWSIPGALWTSILRGKPTITVSDTSNKFPASLFEINDKSTLDHAHSFNDLPEDECQESEVDEQMESEEETEENDERLLHKFSLEFMEKVLDCYDKVDEHGKRKRR